ncbi:MAG TPA: hypothetical protein VMF13_22020 [Luteitalea sp.]|nr:hypothetical protein [Luteitalea sp.]
MDEQQVRALVRDALARHLGEGRVGTMAPGVLGRDGSPSRPSSDTAAWKTHLSHGRFVFLAPVEPDAPCVVEPHVRCHHCGFCQSYGH